LIHVAELPEKGGSGLARKDRQFCWRRGEICKKRRQTNNIARITACTPVDHKGIIISQAPSNRHDKNLPKNSPLTSIEEVRIRFVVLGKLSLVRLKRNNRGEGSFKEAYVFPAVGTRDQSLNEGHQRDCKKVNATRRGEKMGEPERRGIDLKRTSIHGK